ncbi:hypothetical protein OG209_39550 [Streptomyces sp. NBC_01383]|uniref:hypothetical protein n=1 Tax=Streptomyces sp. NBC_01383 TaxID=2903846 RepID=UPI003246DDE7
MSNTRSVPPVEKNAEQETITRGPGGRDDLPGRLGGQCDRRVLDLRGLDDASPDHLVLASRRYGKVESLQS